MNLAFEIFRKDAIGKSEISSNFEMNPLRGLKYYTRRCLEVFFSPPLPPPLPIIKKKKNLVSSENPLHVPPFKRIRFVGRAIHPLVNENFNIPRLTLLR